MGYVEDLKDYKHGQGRNRWRARWRDPAGRQLLNLRDAGGDLSEEALILDGQLLGLVALAAQLPGHEADGHDAVLLRRAQQTRPGSIASGIVLEDDLVEPGQGIADMGRVVDRQPPTALRIDVRKRAVRQSSASLRVQLAHASPVI